MEIPPEVRYVVREGRSIAFQKWGSGPRRVVLVNQATTSVDLMWAEGSVHDRLVEVADQAECVMYDQLGQGASDPVVHVPTLEERAADLQAVLDAAGFQSATISAIFDACLPVIVFAAQHPERVDSVVLFNPFAQGWSSVSPEDLIGWRDAAQVRAYQRAWAEVHEHWGRGDSLAMQMPSLATRRNLRLWALFERAGASPAMIRSVHEAVARADVRPVLPLVRAPALVLRYEDHLLPAGAMEHVAELLPDSRYEVISKTDSLPEFVDRYVDTVRRFVLGDAQAAERRRALRTLMFTDIVGSTERAAAIGDGAWRELLAAHRRVLLRELDAADGALLDHIGDGSVSTFTGPAQAIRCAERLCTAVRNEVGMEIRAGVHTGECELLDGGVAGITVHVAARVSARATAGQVLVSRTVHDLVAGSGISLGSAGHHELKGVPGSWELFEVGSRTDPLPVPGQQRNLRPLDHVALLAARRTPGIVRTLTRLRSPSRGRTTTAGR